MRNQNQVIKLNRQTGAIMWRLGGMNSDFHDPDEDSAPASCYPLRIIIQIPAHHDGALQRIALRIVEFQLDENE